MKITVTGGAGFIGSHLVDLLIAKGHDVLVIDSLEKQVHHGKKPDYLNKKAKYLFEPYEKKENLKKIANETDILVHLAALVGVGQSMYDIKRYFKGNTYNTSILLDYLVKHENHIKKMIVASSMSIYGEGEYFCKKHGTVFPKIRSEEQLDNKKWEMKCPVCGDHITHITTTENKPLYPTSFYAITKKDQEEMFHTYGLAYGVPTVALRFFNVYGERQALSNPYTGVLAIFATRLLNGKSPVIFEDGNQSRDFIHVSDIVNGIYLSMNSDKANFESINLGTGKGTSIKMIAKIMRDHLLPESHLDIVNKYRPGDIRHCFADIIKAKKLLGFKAQVPLKDGIKHYLMWLSTQHVSDNFNKAFNELKKRGLL
ncbi:NAD-dependent epimerase/dehydratase family protein [bacterium]|nr:NAD-dependent epimerase/dehydratase family protein [bacterium]